jgi:hypothetical protein
MQLKGLESVSDTSISFHYISKDRMKTVGVFWKKYLEKKKSGKPMLPLSKALYDTM